MKLVSILVNRRFFLISVCVLSLIKLRLFRRVDQWVRNKIFRSQTTLAIQLDRILKSEPRVKCFQKFLLLNKLIKNRHYTPQTQLLAQTLLSNSNELTAELRAFDFLSQYLGLQNTYIEHFFQKVLDPNRFAALSKRQKARLLPVLAANHRTCEFESIVADIGIDFITQNALVLSIAKPVSAQTHTVSQKLSMTITLYENIQQSKNELRQLLGNPKTSVCVVANGPAEIGSGNGEKIDSYDIVVRINNYSLASPEDYGSKQNIWVKVPNDEVNTNHYDANEYCILASNNYEHKRPTACDELQTAYLSNVRVSLIPNQVFRDLMAQLGGLPSTGLAMVYWLSTMRKVRRQDLFGFSHFKQTDDFKSHYFQDKKTPRHHQHQWPSEVNVLKGIVEQEISK